MGRFHSKNFGVFLIFFFINIGECFKNNKPGIKIENAQKEIMAITLYN
jgi:hypothetical protein